MLKQLKTLLAPVTALALLGVLAGCAGPAGNLPGDPSAFTDQNVRDIVAAAVSNMLEASSFTGVYQSTNRYAGSPDTGITSTESTMNATMLSDRENGRAQLNLSMSIAPSDQSSDLASETLDVTTYLYADYVYVDIRSVPDMPWYKVPVTDSVLDVFSARLIDNEIAMFDLPAEVTYLRNETFDGTDCYVIQVVPNADQLSAMARRQQPQGFDIDWSRLADISQVYRDVTYRVWIATDSLRFLQVTSQSNADFGAAGLFADDPVLAGVTISSLGSVTFTDYNKKLTITLPEEATQAQEVSPARFTQ